MGLSKYLYFRTTLKPLETKIYFVRHIYEEDDCEGEYAGYCATKTEETEINDQTKGSLKNEHIEIDLNNMFLPKSIKYLDGKRPDLSLIMELLEYHTEASHSDHYIFQPRSEAKKPNIRLLNAIKFSGPLISQISFFGLITSDKSSKTSDFVEFIISLPKHADFPIITAKNKLNNFKEISLRFELEKVMGGDSKLYVSDSMFFTEHQHISLKAAKSKDLLVYAGENSVNNSTLGLNAYPAVNGVAQRRNEYIFWTANSHTMTCHYLEQVYEYIVHRSLDRVGSEGMTTVLNDTQISSVRIALGFSDKSRFTNDFGHADRAINEQIVVHKLNDLNMTTSEFVKQHATNLDFMHSLTIPDQVELVGFESKKNGDTFIRLRNRSWMPTEIASNLFTNPDIYINGNEKYLLNGLMLQDEFFESKKMEFTPDHNETPLRGIKQNIHTLEEALPEQYSDRAQGVFRNRADDGRKTKLGPYEMATFRVKME